MNITVFWDVTPYNLLYVHRSLGRTRCLYRHCKRVRQYLLEITVNIYLATRRHIPEDSNIHSERHVSQHIKLVCVGNVGCNMGGTEMYLGE
jgi:hypothetical protein